MRNYYAHKVAFAVKTFLCLFIFFTGNCIVISAQVWNVVGHTDFSTVGAHYPAIAVDGSGAPYVVFSDSANAMKATVMKYNGSSWVNIGAAGFSAGQANYAAIAIDKNGTLYVAYGDGGNSNKITVMKYNGSSWVNVGTPGFSAGTAVFVSLAIDSGGTPYVIYEDVIYIAIAFGFPEVMKYDGAAWVNVGSPGLPSGYALNTRITIGKDGIPYVVFKDVVNGNKATVMKYNSTGWVTVGSAGFSSGQVDFTSIAIDSSGAPYVVYEDGGASNYGATVMKYTGSSWSQLGVAGFSKGAANFTSIAIDKNDIPYVVFGDGGDSNKVAIMKYTGGSWVAAGSAWSSTGPVTNTSITISKSGTLYVVYDDLLTSLGDNQTTVISLKTSTGIKNTTLLPLYAISVFPNPNNGSFSVTISSPVNERAQLIITNLLGEKVKDIIVPANEENNIQLDVPEGIYFVSAICQQGIQSAKIIVQ